MCCRMFAYVGEKREDLEMLVGSLRASARNDTVAARVPLKLSCHPDGWGYVMSSEAGLAYYRSDKPMYEDEPTLPETKGRVHAIFHARKALDGTPVQKRFSHPFMEQTQGDLVFLAHNGSVDKERLERELGFSGSAVDSELALRFALRSRSIEEGTKELEDYTELNGGLNLLILRVDKNGVGTELFVKQFYRREAGKQDMSDFYRLYYQDLAGGRAVFSSTLNDYGLTGRPVWGSDLTPLSAVDMMKTVA